MVYCMGNRREGDDRMLAAVIFDFDGTIADTVPAIREGVNRTMRLFGYPEHSREDILRFINNGARELIRRAMPEEDRGDAGQVDRVLAEYDRQYGEVCLHTRHAYAGVPELIAGLHEAGMRVGVLSNKQDSLVRRLTAQVLRPGSYDAAQGVYPGAPAKPDPFLPHRLADALGVPPAACALVGDSDVDIATAANSGMLHIGVTWGYRNETFLRDHGARLLAHTPHELSAVLKTLEGPAS